MGVYPSTYTATHDEGSKQLRAQELPEHKNPVKESPKGRANVATGLPHMVLRGMEGPSRCVGKLDRVSLAGVA